MPAPATDHLDPAVAAHPQHDALLRRMLRLAADAQPWHGVLFRSAEPKYAMRDDRLDGIGGEKNGGRWNPVGCRCVYGSLTPESAMAETLAAGRHYGLGPHAAMPRTFFAFEAEVTAALDLTDGAARRRLRVPLADLLGCDWRGERAAGREALTQTVGRAALRAGVEALLVPSASEAGGTNLVVFPPALRPGSRLVALNADAIRGDGP